MCKTCGCKDAETLEGEDCGCGHENEAESFGADLEKCPKCDSGNLGKEEMYYCYTCGNDDASEDGCSKCGSDTVGEEEMDYCYNCGGQGHWFNAESFGADENHTNKDYKNMQKDLNKFVNTFCKCKHSKGAPSALNIYTSCGYCGKEIDEVSFYGLTKDAESFETEGGEEPETITHVIVLNEGESGNSIRKKIRNAFDKVGYQISPVPKKLKGLTYLGSNSNPVETFIYNEHINKFRNALEEQELSPLFTEVFNSYWDIPDEKIKHYNKVGYPAPYSSDIEYINEYHDAESFEAEYTLNQMAEKSFKEIDKISGFVADRLNHTQESWSKLPITKRKKILRKIRKDEDVWFDLYSLDAESFSDNKDANVFHSSETFKSSNNNNNIMAAESKFDKLSDKIAKQYRKKGMSAKEAKEIGNKTAYTIGRKKYGKAGMAKKARAGMKAESFEAQGNPDKRTTTQYAKFYVGFEDDEGELRGGGKFKKYNDAVSQAEIVSKREGNSRVVSTRGFALWTDDGKGMFQEGYDKTVAKEFYSAEGYSIGSGFRLGFGLGLGMLALSTVTTIVALAASTIDERQVEK